MNIVCPQCGAKYELDDSICGKTVECSCGRKWLVTAPAASQASVMRSVRRKKKKTGYDPSWVNAMNQKEHVRFKPAPMKKQHRLSLFGKKSDDTAPRPAPQIVECPRCGSRQFCADKSGINFTNAVIGGALFGAVGLLAGLLGKDQVTLTCLNCGHTWKPGRK
ncbi:hypothetical protein [uncultured Victivallis sp.]|uniref:hypothetical protein n=1 Tax=uncultured Victivallis sp. TaxID=354118 RepID=UPI0025CCDE41|nr:hypothetical protein [uncultured Victivallis sp.]